MSYYVNSNTHCLCLPETEIKTQEHVEFEPYHSSTSGYAPFNPSIPLHHGTSFEDEETDFKHRPKPADSLDQFIPNMNTVCDWKSVSSSRLSESFMERYGQYLDWFRLSHYQELSEEFIEKYKEKLDWACVSEFQKLSEDFMRKHVQLIDWERVSQFQKLSEEFIEEHSTFVHWGNILCYQTLTPEFIEKVKGAQNKISEETSEVSRDEWENIEQKSKEISEISQLFKMMEQFQSSLESLREDMKKLK